MKVMIFYVASIQRFDHASDEAPRPRGMGKPAMAIPPEDAPLEASLDARGSKQPSFIEDWCAAPVRLSVTPNIASQAGFVAGRAFVATGVCLRCAQAQATLPVAERRVEKLLPRVGTLGGGCANMAAHKNSSWWDKRMTRWPN